ncbi:MAG: NAD+ synthase [Rikenellaceae bacterium]
MKIALAQLNYSIGDFEANKAKIIDNINKAKQQNADLVVFGEQAISGAPAYDLLNKVAFLDLCEETLLEIASYCTDISVIVGLPTSNNSKTISVAAVIQNQKVLRYVGKKTIKSRNELYHIKPSQGCEYITINDKNIAIVVGEDIKAEQEYGERADFIINITNVAYSRRIIERRYEFYKQLSYCTGKPIIYVNNVGGSTDIVYDGSSGVFNARGQAVCLLKSFEEDFAIVDSDETMPAIELEYQNKTHNVYKAIKLGLGDYFRKNGFTKACIGISGGIDSAVVASMATEVLGKENVFGVMMPSQYSTDHSVDDATVLASNLGIQTALVPIAPTFNMLQESMKPVFEDRPFDVTEENMQARIRGTIMMSVANKFGSIMLNTSNKSEGAVGYGTLYGDDIGAISIIGDLYKTEVYDLARYINRDKEIIPSNTINKAPSAELRPGQKDSDSIPDYDMLDAILYRMIEEGQSREEIINAGFDEQDVYHVYSLVLKNEFKRYQFCPTLSMSTCTFGCDRIMPLTSKYGN